MADFSIQNPANPAQRQLFSAHRGNFTSGRGANFPSSVNELTPAEFGAIAQLAVRGDIVSGRPDSIWKTARIPPNTIYIRKDGLFSGTNIIIRKSTAPGANGAAQEIFSVYWDVNVPKNVIGEKDGVPTINGEVQADADKKAVYASLEELIDAINTRTFPQKNIGADIKTALQARGYVRGDQLAQSELLFAETPAHRLLSWREQSDIWSTLKISNDTRPGASKNTLLRDTMVRFGKTLIRKVYDNGSRNPAEKVQLIVELWSDSKALRSAPNAAIEPLEKTYDDWVLGLLSGLDKNSAAAIYGQDAENILQNTRAAITKETTPAGMENRRVEGLRALDELEKRAAEQRLSGVADKQKAELDDWQKIIDTYRDTDSRARQQGDPARFRQIINSGKQNLDATAGKYSPEAPLRKFAEELKTKLDGLDEPIVNLEPESVASVLNAFMSRYNGQYIDALISISKLGNDANQIKAVSYLSRGDNLNGTIAAQPDDAQKRKVIDDLENEICDLLGRPRPRRGKR
ncbi:MAG: hypothetical protein LBQ83_07035 [Candidatus Margulisbacteria bacterium]|jgi:hypothetical protein|nr:hypothetical protein [Candidatus Margulisiibacteriota bacterium]